MRNSQSFKKKHLEYQDKLQAQPTMHKRLTPSSRGANGACVLAVLLFVSDVPSLPCVSISRSRKCLVRALEWVAFETFPYSGFRTDVSTVRALFAVFIAVCAAKAHCNFCLSFLPFCNAQSLFQEMRLLSLLSEATARERKENVAWNHGIVLDK